MRGVLRSAGLASLAMTVVVGLSGVMWLCGVSGPWDAWWFGFVQVGLAGWLGYALYTGTREALVHQQMHDSADALARLADHEEGER